MKSVPKLIRRFAGILFLSFILLAALNVLLLARYAAGQMPNASPWQTAEETAQKLYRDEKGYHLPEAAAEELKEKNIWAVLIDHAAMKVVWKTDGLPASVPVYYTASDIADLTRGYVDGYPTFTGKAEDGLVVLGYPKKSFWKHMWPSWDYRLIAGLPKTALLVLAVNAALIFLIYAAANSRMLKSIRPIVNGIQSLPSKEPVHVAEKGLLSELAVSINQTSNILQQQSRQLSKKETARANWIAGVSHDIRTPLSMIMGYAGQLEADLHLTQEERQKAAVIVKQSRRMQNLISDLNLASKLEYDMQPVHLKKENITAVVRQTAADFINMDIDGRYPIQWETDEDFTVCLVNADKELMKRAVGNLIQNCINHNEQGCSIYIRAAAEGRICTITVADDGVGASDEQMEKLNHLPHYMVCDENITQQRHGLGLLIVKQIAAVHGGTVQVERSAYGGFAVRLMLPMC